MKSVAILLSPFAFVCQPWQAHARHVFKARANSYAANIFSAAFGFSLCRLMQDMLCKPLPSQSHDLASKPIYFLHRVWPKLGEAIPMKRALDWVSKEKPVSTLGGLGMEEALPLLSRQGSSKLKDPSPTIDY